jgi:hypothetical protein
MKRTARLAWTSANDFSIDGIKFLSTVDTYHSQQSQESNFLLVKNREMIESELTAIESGDVQNIVDIGIWQGGSVVLLDLVFAPRKLVAIEYWQRDLSALDHYIGSRGKKDIVRPYVGVNQADKDKLVQIISEEFGDGLIDLVIDDASHFYQETKASFDVLFPRLREGGKFIIEDWQWSAVGQVAELDYFKGKPGLSNLVLQCMLLCASRPDIISKVTVYPHMAIVTRGNATTVENFSIEEMATNRGAKVPLVL